MLEEEGYLMHEPPGPKRDSIKQDFAGRPRRKTVMGWNSSTVCAEHDILPSSMVWSCVKKPIMWPNVNVVMKI